MSVVVIFVDVSIASATVIGSENASVESELLIALTGLAGIKTNQNKQKRSIKCLSTNINLQDRRPMIVIIKTDMTNNRKVIHV